MQLVFSVSLREWVEFSICINEHCSFCPSCGNRSLKRVQAFMTRNGVVGVGDFSSPRTHKTKKRTKPKNQTKSNRNSQSKPPIKSSAEASAEANAEAEASAEASAEAEANTNDTKQHDENVNTSENTNNAATHSKHELE